MSSGVALRFGSAIVGVVLSSCNLASSLGEDVAASSGSGGGGSLTCDQQVDALMSGASPGYPAIGYTSPNFAAVVDPVIGMSLSNVAAQGAPWPGATLSITRNGKLILARSYGYGDPTTGMYMEPDSLLRLASVSKSITALATLKMIHDGVAAGGSALDLTSTPFSFMKLGSPLGTGTFSTKLAPPSGTTLGLGVGKGENGWDGNGGTNPLLNTITVRELLYHTAGWNRDQPTSSTDLQSWAFDPFFPPMNIPASDTPKGPIAGALGLTAKPPSCKQTLRYILNQPLQFMPGTDLHYSNIGYCALGEMIAELAGTTYEDYVTTNILTPFGMNETFAGATQTALDREVSYFSYTYLCGDPSVCIDAVPYVPTPSTPSIIPGQPDELSPYGGELYLEAFTAFGSWVSSAIDIARFASQIQDEQAEMSDMFAAPPAGWPDDFYTWTDRESTPQQNQGVTDWWYGLGWDGVHAVKWGARDDLYKAGLMNGTSTETWLTSTSNGDYYTLTLLYNGDYPNENVADSTLDEIGYHLLVKANLPADSVDLFPMYNAAYTDWQDTTTFEATLASAASGASRIDGRSVMIGYTRCTPAEVLAGDCDPAPIYQVQYRARLADGSLGPTTPALDQTCDQMITALTPGPDATPGMVVSLQKFSDPTTSSWKYQAVFATPPSAE